MNFKEWLLAEDKNAREMAALLTLHGFTFLRHGSDHEVWIKDGLTQPVGMHNIRNPKILIKKVLKQYNDKLQLKLRRELAREEGK